MNQEHFNAGFIKRAAYHGFSKQQATGMLKQAVGNYLTMGGATGGPSPIAGNALAAPMQPPMAPRLGMGDAAVAGLKNPTMPTHPRLGMGDAAVAGLKNTTMPVASPAPSAQQDMISQFRKYHGTAYNPKSRMDVAKLQNMIRAQQSGGSILQAANAPWR